MTIEDQNRDEKIQNDINKEAAKMSALSSGKIYTYEYLTGEEILPPNQQQMIEQAKFTYSPLGKAFEKQTKTFKDQGEKQPDALKVLKLKEIKPKEKNLIEYDNYFINRLAEIRDITKTIDFNNFTGDSAQTRFIGFKSPLHIFKSIYNGDIDLEDVEKDKKILNHV